MVQESRGPGQTPGPPFCSVPHPSMFVAGCRTLFRASGGKGSRSHYQRIFFFVKTPANRLTPPNAPRQTACMQTLGLVTESKRLRWPPEEHLLAHGRECLGRQLPRSAGLLDLCRHRSFSARRRVFSGNPLFLAVYLAMALGFPCRRHGRARGKLAGRCHGLYVYFAALLYTLAVGRLPGILSILFAGVSAIEPPRRFPGLAVEARRRRRRQAHALQREPVG